MYMDSMTLTKVTLFANYWLHWLGHISIIYKKKKNVGLMPHASFYVISLGAKNFNLETQKESEVF